MKLLRRCRCAFVAMVMFLATTIALACNPVNVSASINSAAFSGNVVTKAEEIGECNGNLVIVSESSSVPLTIYCSALDVSGKLFSNYTVNAAQGQKIITPQGHDLYTYNIFEEVFECSASYEYHESSYQIGESKIFANEYAEENLNISGQEVICGSLLGASENVLISGNRIKNQSLDKPAHIMAVNGDIHINADQLDFYGLIYAPNGQVEINGNMVDFCGIIVANEVVIRGNRVTLNAQNIGIPIEMYSVGPEDAFTGDIMQAGSSGSNRYYYNTGGYGRDCAKYDRYKLLKTVKVGDIIYEANGGDSITPGFGISGHIAVVHKFIVHTKYIYHGESYAGSYSVRQIQLIEAIEPGVCYSLLDDVRCDERDVTILRSNQLTDSKWKTVRGFLEAQIGKKFSFFDTIYYDTFLEGRKAQLIPLPRNKDINTERWYCSELTWAAFLSVGIDLETNSCISEPGITPREINGNYNLAEVRYGR